MKKKFNLVNLMKIIDKINKLIIILIIKGNNNNFCKNKINNLTQLQYMIWYNAES